MQIFGLILIVLFLFSGISADCRARKADVPVHSTQGLDDTTESVINRSQLLKEEKKEQKEERNRSNKYIKLKKSIEKQDLKRLHKEKELEYLEYRLDLKRQKLEMVDSD